MELIINNVSKQYRGGVWGLRDFNLTLGPGVLGHVYNVLGEPLDVPADQIHVEERWPIHRDPPPFEELEPKAGADKDSCT